MPLTADATFSLAHFRSAWRVLCAPIAGTQTETEDGLDFIFSGLPIAFFNVAIVTGNQLTNEDLRGSARRALAWAASAGAPWLFIVTHDLVAHGVDATNALDACGLVPMLPLTGMIAERLTPPMRNVEQLQVDVAGDDATCEAAFDINAAAYGVPLDAAKPTHGKRAYWDSHLLSVGRVDGRPTASAAVMQVDGCRYVALVATLPDQQRRGYAEAVMRHALEASAARFGDQPTTLHATDAGRPIYARMGYQPIGSHTAYIDKAFLAGHE